MLVDIEQNSSMLGDIVEHVLHRTASVSSVPESVGGSASGGDGGGDATRRTTTTLTFQQKDTNKRMRKSMKERKKKGCGWDSSSVQQVKEFILARKAWYSSGNGRSSFSSSSSSSLSLSSTTSPIKRTRASSVMDDFRDRLTSVGTARGPMKKKQDEEEVNDSHHINIEQEVTRGKRLEEMFYSYDLNGDGRWKQQQTILFCQTQRRLIIFLFFFFFPPSFCFAYVTQDICPNPN